MARPLKVNGLRELRAVKTRTRRQLALRRIRRGDAEELLNILDRAESKIKEMEEVEEGSLYDENSG
jgi:hypothetical protein